MPHYGYFKPVAPVQMWHLHGESKLDGCEVHKGGGTSNVKNHVVLRLCMHTSQAGYVLLYASFKVKNDTELKSNTTLLALCRCS